jgi:hypothetical protein
VPGLEDEGKAVPPVRQRAFVEQFQIGDEPNLFSICEDDWSIALEAIAERIRDQLAPACMTRCVADTDPTTDVLDPSCVLEQRTPDGEKTTIPECLPGRTLPDGADVCYFTMTGEDMHQDCQDAGWNLEFDVVRREGKSVPGDTDVTATCEVSAQPAIDCPGLA